MKLRWILILTAMISCQSMAQETCPVGFMPGCVPAPTPSPTPEPTPTPTATPEPTPTATPTSEPTPTPQVAILPFNGEYYGNASVGLTGNVRIRSANLARPNKMDFISPFSGGMESVFIHIRLERKNDDSNSGGNYSFGAGGTAQVLVIDDAGKVIARSVPYKIPSGPANARKVYDVLTKFTFRQPAPIKAGALYSFVIMNTDANPSKNWFSINVQAFQGTPRNAGKPWSPAYPGFKVFMNGVERKGNFPSFTSHIKLASGQLVKWGNPYMSGRPEENGRRGHNGYGTVHYIQGTAYQVKQIFKVPARMTTSKGYVFAARKNGPTKPTGEMIATLFEDAVAIGQAKVPLSQFPMNTAGSFNNSDPVVTWTSFTFTSPVTMKPGRNYELVLKSNNSDVTLRMLANMTSAREAKYASIAANEGFMVGSKGMWLSPASGNKWMGLRCWNGVDRSDFDFTVFFDVTK